MRTEGFKARSQGHIKQRRLRTATTDDSYTDCTATTEHVRQVLTSMLGSFTSTAMRMRKKACGLCCHQQLLRNSMRKLSTWHDLELPVE